MRNPHQSPENERWAETSHENVDESSAADDVVHAYLAAFDRRDLSECLEFFTDDATIFFLRPFTGREAIEKWHQQRFDNDVRVSRVDSIDVRDDVVSVEAAVTSKYLKLGFKLHGQASLRINEQKIDEIRFGQPQFIR